MLFGVDDKIPPEFKVGSSGKKTNHVMVLVTMIQESKTDLLGVERQMATAICIAALTKVHAGVIR